MNKAKEYHLNFIVKIDQFGKQYPTIVCDKDNTGSTINGEIASFISGCGVFIVDDILRDIGHLTTSNITLSDYTIFSGNQYDTIEILSPPPRAMFWGNREPAVPLQEFIDILQEWKDFLNSLPYKHSLSNC